MKEEIFEKLIPIIQSVLSTSASITLESNANNIEEWDSLNHMLLISEVENSFNIKFQFDEVLQMENVEDMTNIIITKLNS